MMIRMMQESSKVMWHHHQDIHRETRQRSQATLRLRLLGDLDGPTLKTGLCGAVCRMMRYLRCFCWWPEHYDGYSPYGPFERVWLNHNEKNTHEKKMILKQTWRIRRTGNSEQNTEQSKSTNVCVFEKLIVKWNNGRWEKMKNEDENDKKMNWEMNEKVIEKWSKNDKKAACICISRFLRCRLLIKPLFDSNRLCDLLFKRFVCLVAFWGLLQSTSTH